MNCPHCQKELPENYGAVYCPFCGQNLPAHSAVSLPDNPSLPPVSVNWWIFFTILLAPAVLALLGSLLKVGGLSVGSPLIGGSIAGIVCGILLARRVGRTTGARVGLGFLFVALMGFLSFALAFTGCMAGGFTFNMH
ncbi:MAG TPA: hypothetical protein VNN22_08720 [Verrucomicrobiae bacterium]|nr:hypothetical protein [Verrucomicrobiae bacterium]